jgi:predicted ATP-dependent serine protease
MANNKMTKFCVDCRTVLEDNGFCPDCKKFMCATEKTEKTEKTVKTEKTEKKEWKSCGYLSKSKNPKVLVVMVKHQRFIVNVDGLQNVFSGKIEYTPIYEYVGN